MLQKIPELMSGIVSGSHHGAGTGSEQAFSSFKQAGGRALDAVAFTAKAPVAIGSKAVSFGKAVSDSIKIGGQVVQSAVAAGGSKSMLGATLGAMVGGALGALGNRMTKNNRTDAENASTPMTMAAFLHNQASQINTPLNTPQATPSNTAKNSPSNTAFIAPDLSKKDTEKVNHSDESTIQTGDNQATKAQPIINPVNNPKNSDSSDNNSNNKANSDTQKSNSTSDSTDNNQSKNSNKQAPEAKQASKQTSAPSNNKRDYTSNNRQATNSNKRATKNINPPIMDNHNFTQNNNPSLNNDASKQNNRQGNNQSVINNINDQPLTNQPVRNNAEVNYDHRPVIDPELGKNLLNDNLKNETSVNWEDLAKKF